MRIARVVGAVWGARHADSLDGRKLVEVELLAAPARAGDGGGARALVPTGARRVAVDGLGAGPGEIVLVAHGSRCRDLTVGEGVADKDVVLAIVDDVEVTA